MRHFWVLSERLSSPELKELEQMLDDPQNSEEDVENIATTIQRFRKNENAMQVQTADVVGKFQM